MDNAVPDYVKNISTTDAALEITVDKYRNLPTYYSSDVVIKDGEKNIVDALSEDLLDDRVTHLVLTGESTEIGNSTSADSSLTVTAAAASNILSKIVQTESNYTSTSAGTTTASYLQINIVDRASAIANFIEKATLPGAQTRANQTGLINFTVTDSSTTPPTLTLNRDQKRAYDSLVSNGLLVTSLSSSVVVDDPLGDFTDYFNTIISATDSLESGQATITSNISTVDTVVDTINTNTGTLESAISTVDTVVDAILDDTDILNQQYQR